MTHADEAFVQPNDFVQRKSLVEGFRPLVIGEDIRDWESRSDTSIVFPYTNELIQWADFPRHKKWSWFFDLKPVLWGRATFSKATYKEEGRPWHEYHQFPVDRARIPLSIAFAS